MISRTTQVKQVKNVEMQQNYKKIQSDLRALENMQIYAQQLGIEKTIIDQAEELYLELKNQHTGKTTDRTVLAAVCLINIVK